MLWFFFNGKGYKIEEDETYKQLFFFFLTIAASASEARRIATRKHQKASLKYMQTHYSK